ncbi:sigma-70 family RNA polymerase sigma factor [Actinophytocola sp.]|uniref:RNA polymerase sigma factor n=1 Tax=Actinophytocola sp. TaxID=1872138 RepID=UPI002D50A0CC|nr:sigma-70 family RNA polymerase sigma factor [Actinophytocola sp.]HYQ68081.1 sigma-70 family RNA polymerase sigma factor [Actinophytocola sp.]
MGTMTMSDLFIGGKVLWLAPVSLLVFGAAFGLIPGLLLRGIVLLYPKDDPRRQELFGELYAPEMGRFERYVWVFQQLETGLRDGLLARRDSRHRRKHAGKLREQFSTNLAEISEHNGAATAQRSLAPGACELSDTELLAAVREGDMGAYGVLYERHLHAAKWAASFLTRSSAEREDMVADAFTRVLRVLRDGRGPNEEFRVYLLVTMRNAVINSARETTVQLPDVPETDLPRSDDDPMVNRWDATTAAKAFASLPEKWRTVLWHTEVEEETPAEIAPLLGMSANGVAALAYRAREGLRQAYLQAHLRDVEGRECQATVSKLAGWMRRSVPVPLGRKISQHLASCEDCRARADTLARVNQELR